MPFSNYCEGNVAKSQLERMGDTLFVTRKPSSSPHTKCQRRARRASDDVGIHLEGSLEFANVETGIPSARGFLPIGEIHEEEFLIHPPLYLNINM